MEHPVERRRIQASIADVWRILANGWMYSGWVVGASRIRDVDDVFPAQGANLHQSVGLWPLVVDDVTTVIDSTPEEELVLRVRSRPWGEGIVRMWLTPAGPGATDVVMREEVVRGPAKVLPSRWQAPIMNWRNRECLDRLAHLAERGAAEVS